MQEVLGVQRGKTSVQLPLSFPLTKPSHSRNHCMLMQYMTTGDSSSWNALFSFRGWEEMGEEWAVQTRGRGVGNMDKKKKKLSGDKRIESRGDEKPNQFSSVVILIRTAQCLSLGRVHSHLKKIIYKTFSWQFRTEITVLKKTILFLIFIQVGFTCVAIT